MRRSVGSGSIKKRTVKKKVWWIAMLQGEDGKYREKWRTTRREAEAALREMVDQRDGRTIVAPDRMTVNDLINEWITASSLKWQESTRAGRIYYMDRYVRPILGKRLLSALQPRDIDTLWTTLETIGPKVEDGDTSPLSRGTVRSIRNMLSTAFNFGVKRRIIPENTLHRAAVPSERKRQMDVPNLPALHQHVQVLPGAAQFFSSFLRRKTLCHHLPPSASRSIRRMAALRVMAACPV